MEHNNYQDQMQHPNYSQELRAILRSHTTPKAFQDQLSDYHDRRRAQTGLSDAGRRHPV